MTDRLDRLVRALERVAHALKMGLLVSGVAVGSAALFYIANRPDDAPAKRFAARLAEGPVPVSAIGPRDWTHVCFGVPGEDVRLRLRDATGYRVETCLGDGRWTTLYETYAEIAVAGPSGCHILPVHQGLFRPARPGEARCEARRGLMMFGLSDGVLTLTRR